MSRFDGPDAPYWEALEDGRLMLPRCSACQTWIWPAAHRCGACHADDVQWVEMPLEATVFTWTRTWHRFGLTEDFELPFTTVLAEIAHCGIRLLGNLEDPDRVDPEIGQRLTGTIGSTRTPDGELPVINWSRV
ncbi:OB-fold domain-containing protein [Tsuneonella flava]|uniref:OB-fold domain-containing protein n=1 Tax=Tsuneonella flava TaxID=2055955 RepID=A0ABX7KBH2_9SPHN|nr:zinc ribbon domain-containing protein [Tsuneonella flava]QSB45349.1 OB-fold domain-containing protein [Tsuneonella flava]